jgi:alpha-L-fucosidase 2
MSHRYDWHFPLTRTHTGMLLGNGTFGAMIWGEGGVLRVTLGRADLWDHRGGVQWNAEMSFANIRAALDAGDEKRLGAMFSPPAKKEGEPQYPSILPIGRFELDFGPEATLVKGTLNLDDGVAEVKLKVKGLSHTVRLAMEMTAPVLCVECPKELDTPALRRVPAWEYVGEYLKSISFPEPQFINDEDFCGWVQGRPVDPPLCVGALARGQELYLTATIGQNPALAQAMARTEITTAAGDGFRGLRSRTRAWWKAYWKTVPEVEIPNERLQFLYEYGMYKFAGLTNPAGVPATLQGPWIEEYQMPPWSSDYHFNINVQMCYWPAYHGNRLENLKPLFEMVAGWTDTLRHNAQVFLGLADGRMLPHAVDDRCTCIGGFWAGSLDHGCTAWVAQMMYRYYRYTMDAAFLRDTAYPFMAGAMRVYEGMLERDGDTYRLPVSVSPEYHTKETRAAWGRNASFQLACIHRLLEDLLAAAEALGIAADPQWLEIQAHLPKACFIEGEGGKQIAIWEGVELEESHRHHSHLGGITPFDVLDADDPAWREVIQTSIARWLYRGPGLWSGWCVPWASMIHTHLGKGEAAELYLEIWERVFTNEGHGTLHDAHVPGFSLFFPGSYFGFTNRPKEVMQIEAGMAATAAIQEMLLHTRRGVNYLFAGAPARWREASFRGMRTDGAFLVSAERKAGAVTRVKVESPAGGTFTLANPWGDAPVTVNTTGKTATYTGAVLAIPTEAGKKYEIVKG